MGQEEIDNVLDQEENEQLQKSCIQLAATAWCQPETSSIVMEPRIAEEFSTMLYEQALIIDELVTIAQWMSSSATFSLEGVSSEAWQKYKHKLDGAIQYIENLKEFAEYDIIEMPEKSGLE